ncbi:hydroxypyruvate isomerase family protein [Salinarimonas ramus]|uniref:Hydroxypyruvate isomerase n=1 Tax=Salinarimonas ramus TaxID=690164 RepID=A0A917Q5A7_9HYPH|nr:TIM barrel protein [Salinarimonas ramus]GGK23928.1 hydroxypyruvate isomerase [Salinarimonas ramus]
MTPISLKARFSANIALLFPDRPLLDRIDAAAACGFDMVECHFPYEHPVEALAERLSAAGVRMTGLNTRPGGPGEWGRAALPGREEAFRADLDEALTYARALGVKAIHVMAGHPLPSDREAAVATYVANLREAADRAAADGITLLLEPLNGYDRPGYLVSRADEIAAILAEIDRPNVKLLFDFYHVQIGEGDLVRRFRRLLPLIGHVQVAAVPDRGEPDGGEIAYRAIFEEIAGSGYEGLVGLEYKPRGDTAAGLAWIEAMNIV